jgi:ABC-type Zn uptake system ZnuABC Zn-binding protein ZnuA
MVRAVATTTIVGDVVRAVAGDNIELRVLAPPGTDPHSYEPTAKDVAAVADADLIFVNGAGLELFLEPLLRNAGGDAQVVVLSEGINLRKLETEHEGEEGGLDPHVWFDPNNITLWARNVEQALSGFDPANRERYAARAQAYQTELATLDKWIQEQVRQIAEADRALVADHDALGYFADRYGFRIVGAVIPGFSTLAEPSAQELAELQNAVRNLGVKAIFVGSTANPSLSQRVAEDTGVAVRFLYTGSLSLADGPATTYLEFMRYNVSQIVDALK